MRRRTAAAALLTLTLSCSSPSNNGSSGPVGRGTAACNQWQTAICGWVTRCGAPLGTACAEQADAISCISDQKAQDCATALNGAGCTAPPAGCDLSDLADPAPAITACNQFTDELCAFEVRCDSTVTSDACHAQAAMALN